MPSDIYGITNITIKKEKPIIVANPYSVREAVTYLALQQPRNRRKKIGKNSNKNFGAYCSDHSHLNLALR
jgi:hypothetical protein